MGIVARFLGKSYPANASTPSHTADETYWTLDRPRFQIGWNWYPGVRNVYQFGAIMGMSDNGGSLRMTPPVIPHVSASIQSVQMGIRDSARVALHDRMRIAMPQVPRR